MDIDYTSFEKVFQKTWIRFKYRKKQFFFNPISKSSVWNQPDHFTIEIPYILHVSYRERIHPTKWEFVLLNNNKFFFFDTERYRSTWKIPDEIQDLYLRYKQVRHQEKQNHDRNQRIQVQQMQRIRIMEEMGRKDEGGEEAGVMEYSDSSDDEFEVIIPDEEEVEDDKKEENEENDIIIPQIRNTGENAVFFSPEEENKSDQVTGKRKHDHITPTPPNLVDKESSRFEPAEKKRKVEKKKEVVSQTIRDFLDLLEESKLTENSTYQQFFRKSLRDVRFRNVHNEKRKQLFSEKIEQIKKQ